jgi:hypothetical protein
METHFELATISQQPAKCDFPGEIVGKKLCDIGLYWITEVRGSVRTATHNDRMAIDSWSQFDLGASLRLLTVHHLLPSLRRLLG